MTILRLSPALLALALLSCSLPSQSQSTPPPPNSTMNPISTHPSIPALTLVAREERLPPLGEPPNPDRPISFAAVFLQLKNPQMATIEVQLQEVEIVTAGDRPTPALMTLAPSQTLTLKPLENSVVEVQLTSPSPYPGQGAVRAIATYQIDGVTYRAESPAVPVQR